MAAAPTTGTAGMGEMGAAFGALSLVSTLFGASSQQQAGKANKALMDRNAEIATFQADDAINRGRVAAKRRLSQVGQTIGAQRVALAAQGVDINSGTAADIQASTAKIGAIDAQTIRNNAAREAWGYKVNAQDLTLRGRLAEREGDNAAASTLLTGSSNLILAQSGFGQSPMSPYQLFTRP